MKKLRPLLACTAALASLPASAAPAAEQSGTSTPVVETTEGKLQGQSSKGVYSFLGIHYGADTSGKNRFLPPKQPAAWRSEEHTSELQSLMRISYAVFCLKKKTTKNSSHSYTYYITTRAQQKNKQTDTT